MSDKLVTAQGGGRMVPVRVDGYGAQDTAMRKGTR
jgi:hypothetical protein